MKLLRSTEHQKRYWQRRKIDWKSAYLDTWTHPHRQLIVGILKTFNWLSLIEIGCGAGANLVAICKSIEGKQVGGIDINADAIALAEKTFVGGVFKVNSADDILMSDKSTDVCLSDMVYIYTGPMQIGRYLRELKRITRKKVVLCEFYSESWWERLKMKLMSGYNMYNWPKMLTKYGFFDIIKYKIPPELWPGGGYQGTFGYVIVASVPKRG